MFADVYCREHKSESDKKKYNYILKFSILTCLAGALKVSSFICVDLLKVSPVLFDVPQSKTISTLANSWRHQQPAFLVPHLLEKTPGFTGGAKQRAKYVTGLCVFVQNSQMR